MSPGLPPGAVRPGVALAARWAMAPRAGWATRRRRLEAANRSPGPPRGTGVRPRALGGVPAEELVPPGADPSARLLYLHGGGYVVGSARTHRALAGALAAGFGAAALVLDYRLAPEHPYPAALHDALAAWGELTGSDGVDPRRIAVAGDSAGAGLALALALSLRDAGRPPPAVLGLIAPWLDLASDLGNVRGPSRDVVLSRGLLRAYASAYVSGGASPRDPLVSPLLAELAGLPPLVIHTTADDLIRADGIELGRRAHAAGVAVTAEDLPGLWHDAHLQAPLLSGPGGGAPRRMGGALRAHVPARP